MSAPEFQSWQLYYVLEPWGWQNDEYRTAVLLAQNYNMRKPKKSHARKPSDFMRDMFKAAIREMSEPPDMAGMTDEQRREFIKAQIKKDFGI